MQENGTDVNVYFPQGVWYSLYDGSITDASEAPTNKSLQVEHVKNDGLGMRDDVYPRGC